MMLAGSIVSMGRVPHEMGVVHCVVGVVWSTVIVGGVYLQEAEGNTEVNQYGGRNKPLISQCVCLATAKCPRSN